MVIWQVVGIGSEMDVNIKPAPESDEIEVHVVFRMPKSNGAVIPFMQVEEALAQRLNEIGGRGIEHLLKEHDSEGEALECEGITWTSKGPSKRVIESPYGPVPYSAMCIKQLLVV